MSKIRTATLIALSLLVLLPASDVRNNPSAQAQSGSRYFPETGHTVGGRFLEHWQQNGALPQFGYPISDELQEVSEVDGKTYTMQYFERAVFELHPNNRPPYDVLLSLLGRQRYLDYYGPDGASRQRPSTDNARFFPETGRTLGGVFRRYWEANGGLMRQGYPISDEFEERSPLDGKTYTVQYFERAVFEHHPNNAGTAYEVLLTQLGTYQYRAKRSNLKIPGPSAPDLVQMHPTGSEAYLLWSDVKVTVTPYPNSMPVYTVTAIFALELQTNRVITVTNNSQIVFQAPRISGSIALWQEWSRSSDCPNCSRLIAKDVRTGATTIVAHGRHISSASIWGRTVVWFELDTYGHRLVAKNIDTGTTNVFASNPSTSPIFLASPIISDQYVAWIERDSGPGIYGYKIQAANTRTWHTQTVARLATRTGVYPSMALFGHYLAWGDPSVKITDLNTGKTTFVMEASGTAAPKLRGNTLIWGSHSPGAQSYSEYSLWGLKLSDRKPLHLLKAEGYQLDSTIAGDWLVWRDKERLHAHPIAQAFANAMPDSAFPPAPPVGDQQLVATSVNNNPVGAGKYLFWLGEGSYNRLYYYDVESGKTGIFAEGPEQRIAVASDGKHVVWVESLTNGLHRIQHYDPDTKQVSTVLRTQSQGDNYGVLVPATSRDQPPYIAVDAGVLYYQSTAPDHKGLWARTLATGEERLVSPVGYGPVAADGHLLWTEYHRPAQTLTGSEWSLHLRSRHNPDEDIVLVRHMYASDYIEYDLSGDDVAWQSGGRGVNRYHIPSRTSTTIPGQDPQLRNRIYHPLISGKKIVWTEVGDQQSWSIQVHDLDSGATTTQISVPRGRRVEAWAILGGRTIAYVMTIYNVPHSKSLYIANMP